MQSIGSIELYALIPLAFGILGALISGIAKPNPKMQSIIQHFVAGLVFAAVATELVPKLLNSQSTRTVAIGFAVGIVVMMLFKWMSTRFEGEQAQQSSSGFLFAMGTDLLIDGLLIGIAFLAGTQSGLIVTIALGVCAFAISASIATSLSKRGNTITKSITIACLMSFLLPIGTLIGVSVIQHFPPYILTETLAFGVAALLYLVVEELIVEAHEAEECSPWITATFFIGFVLIFLIDV